MNIEEIQKFNREKIIMANNPECKGLNEALQKELQFGCIANYCESNISRDGNSCESKLKQGIIYLVQKQFPINDSEVYFVEKNKQYPRLKNERLGNLGILGLPNTLSRVLNALNREFKYCFRCGGSGRKAVHNLGIYECEECGGDGHAYGDIKLFHEDYHFYTGGCQYDYFITALLDNWQLLNENGTDCLLEQQSEETQFAIAKLLGYYEEGKK